MFVLGSLLNMCEGNRDSKHIFKSVFINGVVRVAMGFFHMLFTIADCHVTVWSCFVSKYAV